MAAWALFGESLTWAKLASAGAILGRHLDLPAGTPAMIALKPVLALLFTMVVWGVGPVFIRTVALDLGPDNALVIRYVIVTIVYLTGLFILGSWRIAARDWPRLLVALLDRHAGLRSFGSLFGFEHVPAGIGGLIIGTQPLSHCAPRRPHWHMSTLTPATHHFVSRRCIHRHQHVLLERSRDRRRWLATALGRLPHLHERRRLGGLCRPRTSP